MLSRMNLRILCQGQQSQRGERVLTLSSAGLWLPQAVTKAEGIQVSVGQAAGQQIGTSPPLPEDMPEASCCTIWCEGAVSTTEAWAAVQVALGVPGWTKI